MMGNAMIRCDKCEKLFSIASIKIKIKQAGAYAVGFFSCPHCGEKYPVSCTDREQEERIRRYHRARIKKQAAIRKQLRKKTIQQYEREERKIQAEIQNRAEELQEIGRRILEGEEIE